MVQQYMIEQGDCRVHVATDAESAVHSVEDQEFDLAIVDLELNTADGVPLIRALRQQRSDLCLMMIPLDGEDVAPEFEDLDIQGVLPKPFFLPELPQRVEEAIGRSRGVWAAPSQGQAPGEERAGQGAQAEPGGQRPPQRLVVPNEHVPEVIDRMKWLAQELSAEAVVLTRGDDLMAHTGRLSAAEAETLAGAVTEIWRTSGSVADILGREQTNFEQTLDGGQYTFYTIAVAQEIILSVVLYAPIPLGMIRHRAKQTVDALQRLLSEEPDGA
jgi:DNA-binding response OmpR family regulator